MSTVTSMSKMLPGQKASVISLDIDGDIRRRLLDIGLIEGTKIECVCQSPLGDPLAFRIRGAIIAIRSNDCKNIFVRV